MTDLELQDALTRIKRAQAETDKFVEKTHKLRAEAGKFQRERELQPWQVCVTVLGALLGSGAAFFAAGAAFVKLMGGWDSTRFRECLAAIGCSPLDLAASLGPG